MAATGEIGIRITADGRVLMAEAGRAARAIDSIGDAGRRVESTMRGVGTAIAGYVGLMSAGSAIASLARLSDEWSNISAQVKIATGDVRNSVVSQEMLYAAAQRTSTSVGDMVKVYARLSPAMSSLGKSYQDTISLSESLAKAIKVSGASTQEASAAMLQFGQAMGSGKLQGDEFKSLMENSPYLMQKVAEGMGKPITALKAMGTAGQLTSSVVMAAMEKMSGKINADFASIPQTIGGALVNVKSAMTKWVGETSQSLGAGGGLAAAIQSISNNFGAIANSFVGLGTAFVSVWAVKGVASVGAFVASLMAERRERVANLALQATATAGIEAEAVAKLASLRATQQLIIAEQERMLLSARNSAGSVAASEFASIAQARAAVTSQMVAAETAAAAALTNSRTAAAALTAETTLLGRAKTLAASATAMLGNAMRFLGGPVGLAITAVVALGTALYTNRDKMIELGGTTASIGNWMVASWQYVRDNVTSILRTIGSYAAATWDFIADKFAPVTQFLVKNFDFSGKTMVQIAGRAAFGMLSPFLWTADKMVAAFVAVKNNISGILQAIAANAKAIITGTMAAAGSAWSDLKSGDVSFSGTRAALSNMASVVATNSAKGATSIKTMFSEFAKGAPVTDWVTAKVGGGLAKIGNDISSRAAALGKLDAAANKALSAPPAMPKLTGLASPPTAGGGSGDPKKSGGSEKSDKQNQEDYVRAWEQKRAAMLDEMRVYANLQDAKDSANTREALAQIQKLVTEGKLTSAYDTRAIAILKVANAMDNEAKTLENLRTVYEHHKTNLEEIKKAQATLAGGAFLLAQKRLKEAEFYADDMAGKHASLTKEKWRELLDTAMAADKVMKQAEAETKNMNAAFSRYEENLTAVTKATSQLGEVQTLLNSGRKREAEYLAAVTSGEYLHIGALEKKQHLEAAIAADLADGNLALANRAAEMAKNNDVLQREIDALLNTGKALDNTALAQERFANATRVGSDAAKYAAEVEAMRADALNRTKANLTSAAELEAKYATEQRKNAAENISDWEERTRAIVALKYWENEQKIKADRAYLAQLRGELAKMPLASTQAAGLSAQIKGLDSAITKNETALNQQKMDETADAVKDGFQKMQHRVADTLESFLTAVKKDSAAGWKSFVDTAQKNLRAGSKGFEGSNADGVFSSVSAGIGYYEQSKQNGASQSEAMGAGIGAAIGSIWGPIGTVIGGLIGGALGAALDEDVAQRTAKWVSYDEKLQKGMEFVLPGDQEGGVWKGGSAGESVFGKTGWAEDHWFAGGEMMAGLRKFTKILGDVDTAVVTELQMSGSQIEQARANLFALNASSKTYEFGMEHTDWLNSSAPIEIMKDRYGAIFDAVDGKIGDSIRNFAGSMDDFIVYLSSTAHAVNVITQHQSALIATFGQSVSYADLEKLAKNGEGIGETLTRLNNAFTATNALANMLGHDMLSAFGEVGLGSSAAREEIIALSGGLDAFKAKVSAFNEHFYTAEMRAQRVASDSQAFLASGFSDLATVVPSLSFAIPQTRDEFRSLVESLDLSTDSGRKAFAMLMDLAPAFDAVANYADKLRANFEDKFLTDDEKSTKNAKNANKKIDENLATHNSTMTSNPLSRIETRAEYKRVVDFYSQQTDEISKKQYEFLLQQADYYDVVFSQEEAHQKKMTDLLAATAESQASFYDKYATDEEKATKKRLDAAAYYNTNVGSISDQLTAMGKKLPATREGWLELVNSMSVTDAASASFIEQLLKLASASLDSAEKLTTATEKTVAAANQVQFKDYSYDKEWFDRQGSQLGNLASDASSNVGEALTTSIKYWRDRTAKLQADARATSDPFQAMVWTRQSWQADAEVNSLTTSLGKYLALQSKYGAAAADDLFKLQQDYDTQRESLADNQHALLLAEEIYNKKRNDIIAKGMTDGVAVATASASNSIREWLAKIRGNDQLSALTNQEKYDDARTKFVDASWAASQGDAKALQDLPQIADAFLQRSRDMFASDTRYNDIFNRVEATLWQLDPVAKQNAADIRSQNAFGQQQWLVIEGILRDMVTTTKVQTQTINSQLVQGTSATVGAITTTANNNTQVLN